MPSSIVKKQREIIFPLYSTNNYLISNSRLAILQTRNTANKHRNLKRFFLVETNVKFGFCSNNLLVEQKHFLTSEINTFVWYQPFLLFWVFVLSFDLSGVELTTLCLFLLSALFLLQSNFV